MANGIELPEYLLIKKQEWEREIGKPLTLTQFSQRIGVSVALVSYWMNKKGNPGKENIEKLTNAFGPEIYDVLRLPRPDPGIKEMQVIYQSTPEDRRVEILEMLREWAKENDLDITELNEL